MTKKLKLTESDERLAIELYTTGQIKNLEVLATKFGVGKIKMKEIFSKYNVERNKKGGQIKHNNTELIIQSKVKELLPEDINHKLIARCKKTGLEIDDVMNYSGALTRHILSIYGDMPIPTNTYQRKKYEMERGKKWYEEYFDIIKVDIGETRKCNLCSWETTDINNKTGCFEIHINDNHHISLGDYLMQYPDEIKFHSIFKIKKERENILSLPENRVVCQICGEVMKVVTNTHLKTKHGINHDEYKLIFPNEKFMSETSFNIFSTNYKNGNINMKPTWTSKAEIEIKEFIESLGVEVEKSRNRMLLDGHEIDLILPEHKLGIEYNGLYWHTESKGKHSTYHLNKIKLCNNKGYNLIHIFEDEWINKTTIVKSKIKHILNVSSGIRIGARKCLIKEIKSEDKNIFLNKNHIQGTDKAIISYGAFYNNEMVGVMTFNNLRNMTTNKELEFELSRFATNDTYLISGLASKIIKHFIKKYKPRKIISFADRRWTLNHDNNLYTKMGFELVFITRPNYWYYNSKNDRLKRWHKFGFGKSSLKKKYPYLDFSKSEKELTAELGYDRIWDCGLFKYELDCTNLYK